MAASSGKAATPKRNRSPTKPSAKEPAAEKEKPKVVSSAGSSAVIVKSGISPKVLVAIIVVLAGIVVGAMFSGAVELAVKVPKSGKLLWSNVKSVTPGAGSSMRMTKADAGSPQANVDTSALVGLKAQLAEEKKISSKARDAAEAAENHAKQLADQYAKEKAETAEVVRHLQAQVASAKSTSAAAPTPAATVPQGQAALIGIKNMRLLEKDPDMNVVAAVWNWSWILGKMGEAVSALGPQAPPQAMEYVQQMQAQAGQVGGVPTRENYEMFVANAYQVATALAGILDGGAKVPLHTAYLAAPLRAELCISASCL